MERILIDKQVLDYASMYEKAFRALGHDVPGDLRALKKTLASLNSYNRLSSNELLQYQGYLEEVASDYDFKTNPKKNLLVLPSDEYYTYVK